MCSAKCKLYGELVFDQYCSLHFTSFAGLPVDRHLSRLQKFQRKLLQNSLLAANYEHAFRLRLNRVMSNARHGF